MHIWCWFIFWCVSDVFCCPFHLLYQLISQPVCLCLPFVCKSVDNIVGDNHSELETGISLGTSWLKLYAKLSSLSSNGIENKTIWNLLRWLQWEIIVAEVLKKNYYLAQITAKGRIYFMFWVLLLIWIDMYCALSWEQCGDQTKCLCPKTVILLIDSEEVDVV